MSNLIIIFRNDGAGLNNSVIVCFIKKKKKLVIVLTIVPLCISIPLTKSQFAFVVGCCMQQGNSATGIGYGLLQEIDIRVFCNLVCLLLSERVMLPHTQTINK